VSLNTLNLGHNELTGSIPGYFEYISFQYLDLSHNYFTGMWLQRRRGSGSEGASGDACFNGQCVCVCVCVCGKKQGGSLS
jgi:hypothetical protein